jgi:hypothetical protein
VILGPRNFTTKKVKTGPFNDSVLLSKPTYVSVEDPFKKPLDRVMRSSDAKGHTKAGHDVAFKPAKHVRLNDYKAPYEH